LEAEREEVTVQAEELVLRELLFLLVLLELAAVVRLVWDTGAWLHQQPLSRALKRRSPLRCGVGKWENLLW